MIKISGIVITKNEESMIQDCLDSIAFCDEIIVVDNQSSDQTVHIAEKMGAKVIVVKTTDFSELRNAGLEKATGKWILYVDADERVSLALKTEIQRIVAADAPQYVTYKIQRKNYYYGNYEWPYIDVLERLFMKRALKGWKGELHESPLVLGEVGILQGYLLHYSRRNIAAMVAKTIQWSKTEAELRVRAHHPEMKVWRFFRVMFTTFIRSYVVDNGWKMGTAGVVESIYQTFSIFVTYARLWELQQFKK